MKHVQHKFIRISLAMAAAIVVAMTPVDASAQTPGGGFQSFGNRPGSPYQQRLSPYLDLLRADNSTLGPYHSFVQPRRQFQSNQNAQARQLQTIQRSIQQNSQGARPPRIERTPTGRGATFNNYLHYYQFNATGRR